MDWADAITVANGNLAASIVSASGERSIVPLQKLATMGIPTYRSTPKRFKLKLSDLTRAPADAYLDPFNFPTQNAAPNHAVFVHYTRRTVYLIPALSLLRGMFKPARFMLEEAFRPQALECLAIDDPLNKGRPKLIPQWAQGGYKLNFSDPLVSLSWFWRDPKARHIANSVHRHAMNGRIDIDLASMEVQLSVQGKTCGNTTLVTKVFVVPTDGDEPCQSAHAKPTHRPPPKISVAGKLNSLAVLPAPDGQVKTTDDEWSLVSRCLLDTGRKGKFSDCRKEVFDNLLRKVSGEISTWRNVGTAQMSVEVHLYYYRRWTETDELPRMIDELNKLRVTSH